MKDTTKPNAIAAPSERQCWTIKEFCENFRIGHSTAYRLIKSGRIQTVKIGGRRMVPAEAAAALLKGADAA